MSNKLGQEPVFPMCNSEGMPSYVNGMPNLGMSKRFYAACAAMQGLLSSEWAVKALETEAKVKEIPFGEALINNSYQFADELLKQENQ